jgi:2-hydroxy-6-oxonona-2,4-dienedioate hydrolase
MNTGMRPSMWEDFLGGTTVYRDAGGVRTRSLEAGAGEPVLLLHGNGGHAEIYIRNIMPLAEHFHVYAIDSLGHGFTDKPDVDYTIPDYAKHVEDFITTIGGPVHIVGHGLAGWVATYLTVRRPELVRSLVNFNGLTHLREPDDDVATGFRQIRQLSTNATASATLETVRKRLEWALQHPERVTEEMVRVRYDIYRRPDSVRAMAKIVQVESAAQRVYGVTAAELATIRCPVQLIFAPNPVEKIENFERMRDAIPGSRLDVIHDGGLIAMWETPEDFNRIVQRFLLTHSTHMEGARR